MPDLTRPDGRAAGWDELRALTPEQRERLGQACARLLGTQRVKKPPE